MGAKKKAGESFAVLGMFFVLFFLVFWFFGFLVFWFCSFLQGVCKKTKVVCYHTKSRDDGTGLLKKDLHVATM